MTEFGYRNEQGMCKFHTLPEAISYWKNKGTGSICEKRNSRWYVIDVVRLWNKARTKTALHMLARLIKTGYSATGTDAIVEGSPVYGSYWWQIVRDAILDRDNNRCQLCGCQKKLHVHHIMPKRIGGSDHPVNLISLCIPCHKMVHHNRNNECYDYYRNQTRLDSWIDSNDDLANVSKTIVGLSSNSLGLKSRADVIIQRDARVCTHTRTQTYSMLVIQE